ncbi:hypothetical protein B0H19DRAFT_1083601 [Mycena capillaripes]|nr:hypothetical protein B0H19DRAFT_1083601 [Mycena capillaripes]
MLYLGCQVLCKPQDPGSQFQSRNLGTATSRKFHASSDPQSSGQRHYHTSSHSSIYRSGAPVSARPTLGGFWMCCSCLCARPQLLVFIPARGESEADVGLGAHGCDDEVHRSFGQGTRMWDVDPLALKRTRCAGIRGCGAREREKEESTHGRGTADARVAAPIPAQNPQQVSFRATGTAFILRCPIPSREESRLPFYRSPLRAVWKDWKGMMYGNGATRIDAKLVVAQQLIAVKEKRRKALEKYFVQAASFPMSFLSSPFLSNVMLLTTTEFPGWRYASIWEINSMSRTIPVGQAPFNLHNPRVASFALLLRSIMRATTFIHLVGRRCRMSDRNLKRGSFCVTRIPRRVSLRGIVTREGVGKALEKYAKPSSFGGYTSLTPADAQQDEEEPPDSDTEEEGESDADSDVKNTFPVQGIPHTTVDPRQPTPPAGARGTSGASNTLTSSASDDRPPPASVPAASSSSIDVRGTRLISQRSATFSVYTNPADGASSRAADSGRPAIPSTFASVECSLILRRGEPIWTIKRYLLQIAAMTEALRVQPHPQGGASLDGREIRIFATCGQNICSKVAPIAALGRKIFVTSLSGHWAQGPTLGLLSPKLWMLTRQEVLIFHWYLWRHSLTGNISNNLRRRNTHTLRGANLPLPFGQTASQLNIQRRASVDCTVIPKTLDAPLVPLVPHSLAQQLSNKLRRPNTGTLRSANFPLASSATQPHIHFPPPRISLLCGDL